MGLATCPIENVRLGDVIPERGPITNIKRYYNFTAHVEKVKPKRVEKIRPIDFSQLDGFKQALTVAEEIEECYYWLSGSTVLYFANGTQMQVRDGDTIKIMKVRFMRRQRKMAA